MRTILLISPYWKEDRRWMVSSVKLAELWQRLGYRVAVACMGAETSIEEVSDTLTIYRKKDLFLPDPWNYGIAPGFTGLVRRVIAMEKPDVIIVNKILFWTSFSMISLRARGTLRAGGIPALVLTDALVGMTWWGRTFLFRLVSRIYAWTLGWLILRCADRIVFFHPQPERLLKFLGVAGKMRVIPTGIDVARYSFSRSLDLKNEQRATSKQVTMTYVGRLESVKGVDDFLAAAVPLKKQFPQMKIQVVGWYRHGHPLVVQYRCDVHFTGLRDDIPAILAATDIFVLPSHSEGLSNALMEAMASGCACVATEVGGNSFLLQNGISGFLFPPGDREALLSHLRRLLDDPAKRRSLGEAARARIEKQFSWAVVGELYRHLFEEVLKN
ncbi:glycosyltransferase family 4 protein [Candidatus Peregrinibacteria bacterium]|nr:glycosyltransferase family 4 protein [Candidatus Peregrinibacteria bacterium]